MDKLSHESVGLINRVDTHLRAGGTPEDVVPLLLHVAYCDPDVVRHAADHTRHLAHTADQWHQSAQVFALVEQLGAI